MEYFFKSFVHSGLDQAWFMPSQSLPWLSEGDGELTLAIKTI